MKVKEVRFEKLFSLAKYNNERIGFTVEVEEGDDPDKIAGERFFKILAIEGCLNKFRSLVADLDYASRKSEEGAEHIRHTQLRMAEMKVNIQELLAKAEKGDVDSKLRHACERDSYKTLTENLAKYEKEAADWNRKLKLLADAKEELETRIKQGNFSLEGLQLPQMPAMRVYFE